MGTRLRDRNDSQLSRSDFTSILDRNQLGISGTRDVLKFRSTVR